MKKKIVKSKKRVPKFQDGGIGKLKPRTALEAAKDLKINPTIATAQTLEEQSASAKDLLKGLMRPPVKEVTPTAPAVTTPKSVAAKNSKTISDSYKKSLQGLMDKGKSVDELVKLGYGTKQGLTNLGLTAPKKPAAPKPTAPKKATATKPTTPKKPTASDLKKEGQRLKAEGMKQKGIGMAIKGKALRNKAIDKTLYEEKYSAPSSKALIKLGANPKKPNLALRTAEAIAASRGKLEMSVTKGKNRYSTDGVPSKSKLTKVEKEAIAKYKANPKNQKTLKLDPKKFSSDELAKSNYGNNIVGDLMSGPVKAAAAAVGAGAGIYGLYKAGKNLSNVGKAFTKSVATKAAKAGGSQVAANTARKVALAKSSKQFANKRALKVVKNLSKERAITQAAKKSFSNTTRLTKEKLGKEFAKNVTEKSAKNLSKNAVSKDIAKRTTKKDLAESFARKLDARKAKEAAKDASKKGAQKLLGPGQKMLSAPKGSGQLKFNFRKGGKVTKMKRSGKKC